MKKLICGGGKGCIFIAEQANKRRKDNLIFAKTAVVIYAAIVGIVLWQTYSWPVGAISFILILLLGKIADWLTKSYN